MARRMADATRKVTNAMHGMPSVDPVVDRYQLGWLLISLHVAGLASFLTWHHEKETEETVGHCVKRELLKGCHGPSWLPRQLKLP
jgi:hypothetical protein